MTGNTGNLGNTIENKRLNRVTCQKRKGNKLVFILCCYLCYFLKKPKVTQFNSIESALLPLLPLLPIKTLNCKNKMENKSAGNRNELKLILPYPPSVNNLYATFGGRRITSAKGRKFKSDIAVLAKRQGARLLNGDLSVTFRVFRPRKIGDLDNRLKISQDALKGICFADDKQIIEIHAFRFDDAKNPRIEIDLIELRENLA